MFNFIVISQAGGWDEPFVEVSRSRFLEYTNDDIAERFQVLGTAQKAALMSLPCLFAYEGTLKPMRVGRIQTLGMDSGGRTLQVYPAFDDRIPAIPFDEVKPLQASLDIRRWELNRTHWAVKEGELYEILENAGLGPLPLAALTVELPPVEDAPIQVDSVGEFIGHVLGLTHGDREVFYRGHSNRLKFRLEPGILRKDDQGNFLYRDDEDKLYRELLVSNSIDFHGDVYTLDRLVRMQHYALPTRLLDITSNPLIALYFACNANTDVEGEVIVFSIAREDIKYFDSDTASCIANLARLPKTVKDRLDFNLVEVDAFNAQPPAKSLLHLIKEEKPFFEPKIEPEDLKSIICVKGKRANSRIAFQAGAFLLYGLDATLNESGTSEILVQRISVKNKETVLRELDQLNINESTVFPYIENSSRYLAKKFTFKSTAPEAEPEDDLGL